MNKTRLLTLTTTAMLGFALMPDASAGKLADGLHGIPYGPDSVVREAPGASCTPGVDQTAWFCTEQLGDAKTTVGYMASDGFYYGAVITAEGFGNATALRRVLGSAYGKCAPMNTYDLSEMRDCIWRDHGVAAIWRWNQFSRIGSVVIVDQKLSREVKAIEQRRAAKAAESL